MAGNDESYAGPSRMPWQTLRTGLGFDVRRP